MFDVAAWRYFSTFYRGRFVRLAWLAAVSMMQSLLVLPMLYLIKRAFDVAIPDGDIRLLVLIGIAILSIRLIATGISLWLRAAYLKIIKAAVTEIRESLLRRLYTLPRSFYTEMDRDQVHARLVMDTERIDNMNNVLVSTAIPAVLMTLVLTVVLLVVSPLLLVTLMLLVPLLFLAAKKSGRSAKEGVYLFQRAFESFSKGTLFVLHHMDLTRAQASEAAEIDRQLNHLHRLRATGESMAFRFAVHSQVQHALTSIAIILILVVGGAAVIEGSMTLGEFLAFYVAAGLLSTYLNTLASALPEIISGSESMATLHELALTKSPQPYNGSRHVEFTGRITLDHVCFSYGAERLLNDVNLEIRPGGSVALIGPNGAGKSTIAHLILGFYRPSSGMLLADGIAYDDIDLSSIRRNVGIVTQHPEFFSGTIGENLRYGSAGASDADVVEAAATALIYEFIRQQPGGFDTAIGPDGVLLSGGQCQRIAIARALLRKPKLLIMDEPTNHLDSASVDRLLGNINALRSGPAILLISHDPAVISMADRVYQLERGELKRQMERQLA